MSRRFLRVRFLEKGEESFIAERLRQALRVPVGAGR